MNLYNKSGGSGVLYASWAKTLASEKKYEEAIHLFNMANQTCIKAMGYEDFNSLRHIDILLNRDQMDRNEFVSYMRSISGNPSWKEMNIKKKPQENKKEKDFVKQPKEATITNAGINYVQELHSMTENNEITTLDSASLFMQNHFILDYLVDSQNPQNIEYTSTSLFDILSHPVNVMQYIVPRITALSKQYGWEKEISITDIKGDVSKDLNIAKANINMNLLQLKSTFQREGYSKFKAKNIKDIKNIHNKFNNLKIGHTNSFSWKEETIFNRLLDINQELLTCLYKNEAIALHEEGRY